MTISHESRKGSRSNIEGANGADMSQPHLVTNPSVGMGLGRTGLRRGVPSTQQLLKPKVFSESPKNQRPA